ncbi:MAG: hypothetical protein V9G12_25155 [Microthrixaceae bacterium]
MLETAVAEWSQTTPANPLDAADRLYAVYALANLRPDDPLIGVEQIADAVSTVVEGDDPDLVAANAAQLAQLLAPSDDESPGLADGDNDDISPPAFGEIVSDVLVNGLISTEVSIYSNVPCKIEFREIMVGATPVKAGRFVTQMWVPARGRSLAALDGYLDPAEMGEVLPLVLVRNGRDQPCQHQEQHAFVQGGRGSVPGSVVRGVSDVRRIARHHCRTLDVLRPLRRLPAEGHRTAPGDRPRLRNDRGVVRGPWRGSGSRAGRRDPRRCSPSTPTMQASFSSPAPPDTARMHSKWSTCAPTSFLRSLQHPRSTMIENSTAAMVDAMIRNAEDWITGPAALAKSVAERMSSGSYTADQAAADGAALVAVTNDAYVSSWVNLINSVGNAQPVAKDRRYGPFTITAHTEPVELSPNTFADQKSKAAIQTVTVENPSLPPGATDFFVLVAPALDNLIAVGSVTVTNMVTGATDLVPCTLSVKTEV